MASIGQLVKEMSLGRCDLCGETSECLLKEIEGKEYDICVACWDVLSAKLSGKGRAIRRESVVLVPTIVVGNEEAEKPSPGKPPKIWYSADNH